MDPARRVQRSLHRDEMLAFSSADRQIDDGLREESEDARRADEFDIDVQFDQVFGRSVSQRYASIDPRLSTRSRRREP